ncbi:hypothetical protein ACHAWF_016304 [Thalassiosira exigua]
MTMTNHGGDSSPSSAPAALSPGGGGPSRGNPLLHDLSSLLFDEEVADVRLVPEKSGGGDAAPVPAIRAILAARSPVFRRMLYGEFREHEGDAEVRLDYSGRVLRLLVEFCFTDKLSLGGAGEGGGGSGSDSPEERARLLARLSGAAHYLDIPKLEHDVRVRLEARMVECPSLACAILDEASGMLSGEELGAIAMERVRARPRAALLRREDGCGVVGGCGLATGTGFPSASSAGGSGGGGGDRRGTATEDRGGVVSLNASLLEQVIFDDKSAASELTKFLCLQKWVEGCRHEVTLEDVEDFPRKRLDTDDDEVAASRTPTRTVGKRMGGLGSASASDRSTLTPPPSPPSKAQNDEASTPESQRELRLRVARHLAAKVDLSQIPASDLSTTVADSDLVPEFDLFGAYRLQALNAERSRSRVVVEGAGLSEVNGTYVRGGVHEGTPMYNKEGVWRDREEVFRIFLCTYSNGNKSWCLSIVPRGKEPGKTTDLDFYECPVSYGKGGGMIGGGGGYGGAGGGGDGGMGAVPARGWKLVNYGQPPVPKCSLIPGCLEDG